MSSLSVAALLAMAAAGSVCGEEATETKECLITLSDDQILVDDSEISTDPSSAVYAGAPIVYYQEGQGELYGEGDAEDEHSAQEAAEHTVITITQPGTYRVTGSISRGQIAVDLGEEAEEEEAASVNLILDNADITCTAASAIVVCNAYECGSDDTETASREVDTSEAGFQLILADDSENTVNGSHVAKIYREGTTQEEVDAGEAKKAYKFDAAIDSLVSFNIDGEEKGNGVLNVVADNEGISSALHMTVNGGEIHISSGDDAINTSEDGVSVFTVNDGTILCASELGTEGDGIDSNGWIVMNGGYVISSANAKSQDSGVDSDLGIYINGGTLLASGNMYDEVSADSAQRFMVLNFAQTMDQDQQLLLKDGSGEPVAAFFGANTFQTMVYSSDSLTEGDYTLYKVSSVTGDQRGNIYTDITDYTEEAQLQYSSDAMTGFGKGGRQFGGQKPENGEMPGGMKERQNGEKMPEGMEPGQRPDGEMYGKDMEPGERPENIEVPEGAEPGEKPDGMEPPEDMEAPDGTAQTGSTVFTLSGISNSFSGISEAAKDSGEEIEI